MTKIEELEKDIADVKADIDSIPADYMADALDGLATMEASLAELKAKEAASPTSQGKTTKAKGKDAVKKTSNRKPMSDEQKALTAKRMSDGRAKKAAEKATPVVEKSNTEAKATKTGGGVDDAVAECKKTISDYRKAHPTPKKPAKAIAFLEKVSTDCATDFKKFAKHVAMKTDKDVDKLVAIYKDFITELGKFAGVDSHFDDFKSDIDEFIKKGKAKINA